MKKNILFCLLFQSFLYGQSLEVKELIETLNHKKDIVYKKVDGISLEMDIYYPDSAKLKKNNPWMLYVHGGGWRGGDRYKIFRKSFVGTLKSLLEKGVVCVTIEYRRTRGNSTAYDAVVDSKDAARYLLKNAQKYKLDTNKYGVWGGSAGGHLSLVTALGKNSDYNGDRTVATFFPNFKCVVSYFPATSLINPALVPGSLFENEESYHRILGDSLKNKQALAKLLSPAELLEKNSPPILLIHGDKDTVLPIINSTYFLEVAKENDANVELLVIKNAGHSFSGSHISPSMDDLNQYATNFILSHLYR